MNTSKRLVAGAGIASVALLLNALSAQAVVEMFNNSATANVLRQYGYGGTTNLATTPTPTINTPASLATDGSGNHWNTYNNVNVDTIIDWVLPAPTAVGSYSIEYGQPTAGATLQGWNGSWNTLATLAAGNGVMAASFASATVSKLRLLTTQVGTNTYTRVSEAKVFRDGSAEPLYGTQSFGAPVTPSMNYLPDLVSAAKVSGTLSTNTGKWDAASGSLANLVNTDMSINNGVTFDGITSGDRTYLLLIFNKPYQMDYTMLGSFADAGVFGQAGKSEIYTLNGSETAAAINAYAANAQADLVAKGWTLQQAWNNNNDPAKGFLLNSPGLYNELLIVQDAGLSSSRLVNLEMFGVVFIPEPTSLALLALGALALLKRRRK